MKNENFDFEKVFGRIAVVLLYCFAFAYGPGFLWQVSHLASVLMIIFEVLLVLGFISYFMLFVEPHLHYDEEEKKEEDKTC